MLLVTTTHSAFFGLLKTYDTAGVSCDPMIMEYTHDEYYMSLTLGTCNSRVSTAAREYPLRFPSRLHPDDNVFWRLEQCLVRREM
jgi:hypothetical protein